MIRITTLTTIFAVSVLGLSGCEQEKITKGSQSELRDSHNPGASPKARKRRRPTSRPGAKVTANSEVMAEIKAIASKCKVEPKNMQVKCANKENAKLENDFYGNGKNAKDYASTLGTFALALHDSDPKIQTVAARVLGTKFARSWGPNVAIGAVNKKVAALMRKAIPTLGKYQARNAIVATVYASSLSNSDKELYTLLSSSDDIYLKSKGWAATMFYARMKAFPKIKALAGSGDSKAILSALTAVNKVPKYSNAEKAKLCPWAHRFLGSDSTGAKESKNFEQAGYVLTKCSGEWVDKLLDWGEAQQAKKTFDRRYYFVYRGLCHSFMKGVHKVGATPKQCNRNYSFLEKVANTDGILLKSRAMALTAISYQRRDEKSYKLMIKYAASPVPELKAAATKALKTLERYTTKK